MYYATGLPGWMRYGCRGWVARGVAPGSARPAAGFRGVPYEGRYASDDAGMSEEREKQLLSQQAQFLRSELEVVERRISDMASPDRGSTEGGK